MSTIEEEPSLEEDPALSRVNIDLPML